RPRNAHGWKIHREPADIDEPAELERLRTGNAELRISGVPEKAALGSNRQCNTSTDRSRTWPRSDARACPSMSAAGSGTCGSRATPSVRTPCRRGCGVGLLYPQTPWWHLLPGTASWPGSEILPTT